MLIASPFFGENRQSRDAARKWLPGTGISPELNPASRRARPANPSEAGVYLFYRERQTSFERHLGSEAAERLPGRPTAIHAASRHLPCSFVHTVMTRLLTSAILPLLSARRCICSSTIAVSP